MTAVQYEREICGRCGGSGRYSFNMIDGSRCYDCGGTGKRLTKRGAAAREFATSILEKPVQDIELEEGQQAVYRDALTGRRWKIAQIVEVPSTDGLRSFELRAPSGNVIAVVGQGTTLRMISTKAQAEAILDYQKSLTKEGKPRKR